jgi:hypothetical protein
MPISDADNRDATIRTVIGEAGDQSPDGQAAVANVIANRLASGQWGDNAKAVVLAPGQFEPWQTRPAELARINRNSKQYRDVGQIVDSVASGDTPDLTGGSTHFLQPETVRARRGGSLPDWAQGPAITIGAHNFYSPGNPNFRNDGMAAINAALHVSPIEALAYTDDKPQAAPAGSMFRDAGFAVPSAKAPAQAPAGSLFKDAGFAVPTTASVPVVPTAPAPQMLGDRPLDPWETTPGARDPNPTVTRPKTWLETVHDAIPDPNKILAAAAQHVATSTAENFQGSKSLAASGVQEFAIEISPRRSRRPILARGALVEF